MPSPIEIKVEIKDAKLEMIIGLLQHARSDARLAELTASAASYWHTAEDCKTIGIIIEKSLFSMGVRRP